MKKEILLIIMIAAGLTLSHAQNTQPKTTEPKKTIKEKVEAVGEMLIAQPDAAVDTNANKIVNSNLSIVVPLTWKEKGALIFNDFKLSKADIEPTNESFPIADKKIVQGMNIGINTLKKPAAEKKQMVLTDIKAHLAKFYKDAAMTITPKELDEKVAAALVSTETFTTAEGKQGELYVINDVQSQQTNFHILLLIPSANNSTVFVHFNYLRYVYETTYPEDPFEWRMFVYPDDQQAYVDFTKGILKTLVIK